MKKCKQCGAEYQAKRSTSRYCSPACRVKARRLSVTDQAGFSVTDVSVTASDPVSVTQGPSLHELNCTARGVNTCNTGPYKTAAELAHGEVNRVSLPGDADYTGVTAL